MDQAPSRPAAAQPARISIAEFDAILRESLPMMVAWGVEILVLEHGRPSRIPASGPNGQRPGLL